MKRLDINGPIILDTVEDIVAELRRIATAIENGSDYGEVVSDLQVCFYEVSEDDYVEQ